LCQIRASLKKTRVQNDLIDTPYHSAYQSAQFLTKTWRGLLYSCSVSLSKYAKVRFTRFTSHKNLQEISLRSSTEVLCAVCRVAWPQLWSSMVFFIWYQQLVKQRSVIIENCSLVKFKKKKWSVSLWKYAKVRSAHLPSYKNTQEISLCSSTEVLCAVCRVAWTQLWSSMVHSGQKFLLWVTCL
jgi:hypothetical protein